MNGASSWRMIIVTSSVYLPTFFGRFTRNWFVQPLCSMRPDRVPEPLMSQVIFTFGAHRGFSGHASSV